MGRRASPARRERRARTRVPVCEASAGERELAACAARDARSVEPLTVNESVARALRRRARQVFDRGRGDRSRSAGGRGRGNQERHHNRRHRSTHGDSPHGASARAAKFRTLATAMLDWGHAVYRRGFVQASVSDAASRKKIRNVLSVAPHAIPRPRISTGAG